MPISVGVTTVGRRRQLAVAITFAIASIQRSGGVFVPSVLSTATAVSVLSAGQARHSSHSHSSHSPTMSSPVGPEERVVIVGGGIGRFSSSSSVEEENRPPLQGRSTRSLHHRSQGDAAGRNDRRHDRPGGPSHGRHVGASTAYHLALRGIKSVVVERAAVAAAASGKAGGFLAGGWGSGPTVRMHEVGFAMHEELADTLEVTSYRKIPTLQVNGARKGSSPAPWLDGKAAGSMMDPDTAQVTPLELTTKLIEAAKARGAEVRIATVAGVSSAPVDPPSDEAKEETEKGGGGKEKGRRRVTAVVLEGGEEIPCDRVIIAMGPWSCLAEEWFNIPVPMQGIKSTSMVFKGSQAVADDPYALFCAEDRNGCHLEVYPRPTGEVYLCGLGNSDYVDPPRLKAGGDCEKPENISPDPLRVTAATKSFKGLSSLGNEAPDVSQACMRPCPPDGLPIMGEVPGISGAYISAGHNCWGILWGPVTGLLMAELLVDGKASTVDIHPFSPTRFMQRAGRY